MSHFFTDALILILLIMMTSFFVAAEIAMVASKKSRLNSLSKTNNGAKKAIELSSNPEDFLSTVQVGITLISVIIGIYGGAAISSDVAEFFGKFELFYPYREEIGYALVVLVITYFTVLGEVIPKRIAMLYPENVASVTSYFMLIFTKLFYPLVKLLGLSTKMALAILKVKEPKSQLTMEELRMIINQAEVAGMLAATEHDLLRRIIHLSNAQVGAIMTPRNKMVWLDISDDDKINLKKISSNPFQCFPVIENGVHNLIGIISIKNLQRDSFNNQKIIQRSKDNDVLYIPDTARVSKLIDLFRERKARIALVVDEYGDIEGLVTLNDVLKILVGDLAIGIKNSTPDVVKNHDGSYIVNGNIMIEELMSILEVSSLPTEQDEEYRTLAGFMLAQINKLPENGDNFCAVGWSFRIIKMDKRRIERVLLKKL